MTAGSQDAVGDQNDPMSEPRRGATPSIDFGWFARSLVAGSPDAILYADRNGIIAYWNAGAERIFGFTAEEAIGQSLDLIIPENLRQRHWHGFEKTMQTGETRYGAGELLSVPALKKDSTRISVEFSIVPFFDNESQIIGMAAVLRDATKQFETIKSLRRDLTAKSAL